MIAFLHTEDGQDFMFGIDHMPTKHEVLRVCDDENGEKDERDGMYEIVRVVTTVPRGRVDVYAVRYADAPRKVRWEDVMPPKFVPKRSSLADLIMGR